MPPTDRFVYPGYDGYDPDWSKPQFAAGDFVTTNGTRPGACHRVLECLGVSWEKNRRWYMVKVGSARVRICEDDLQPVEVVEELGRITDAVRD